jgi:hypothetical protein
MQLYYINNMKKEKKRNPRINGIIKKKEKKKHLVSKY